jgi:hypothetical protein
MQLKAIATIALKLLTRKRIKLIVDGSTKQNMDAEDKAVSRGM